ncbi:acyltransferase family protein [Avibacterium sp. 21-599]|uniref:acyltransferase family protein n=1 Tax=Avibacterium sp. 21-599 TaxID=2911528 RepID=UPI002245CAD0|nr:acyltransferase family protein [Avibacterium sp. 21-599]MCW9718405.1 acyltransferase [Avibacterium sp. 21-599]
MFNISKEQSQYIKGWAVVLMFIHHVFGFPNRAPEGMFLYLFPDLGIEFHIGALSKYCVSIFLFISGYGFAVTNHKNNSYYFNKIFSTYRVAWIVFIICIPLDIYFKSWNINLGGKEIFLNFFGFSSSYNGEWWFLLPYLLFVAITPLLQSLRNKVLSLIGLAFVLHNVSASGLWGEALYWFPAYVIGFSFGILKDYVIIRTNNILFKILFVIVYYYFTEIGYRYFGVESMVFLVPFVIYIFLSLFEVTKYIPGINKMLFSFGNKCIYMWLVHSFFAYHFLAKIIYYPKYTILVLLNLLVITYLAATILSKIDQYIVSFFVKIDLKNKLLSVR